MKYLILFLVIFIFSSHVAEAQLSEVLDSKRTWNLLRDIKDYQAGRLKTWTDVSDNIKIPEEITANYITLIGDGGLPDSTLDFGVSFPFPKVKHENKDIEMVIVELDFKWPIAKGWVKLSFEKNTGGLNNFGVWLNGDTKKICVGSFSSPSFSSINISQTKTDSLKIVYKPKEESFYAVYDKKTYTCSEDFKPKLFSLSGDGFDTFQISRLQMMVIFEDK